jgi:hypothetical protein
MVAVPTPAQPATSRAGGRISLRQCSFTVGTAGAAASLWTWTPLGLFAAAGMHAIVDESPAGGRHLYAPLATPRELAELRPVLTALEALLPSADPAPMRNVVRGCIRPPGAWHKSRGGHAGHQRLLTPLAAAIAIAHSPAPDAAWHRLL